MAGMRAECSICGRVQAVMGDYARVVHHGYQQPWRYMGTGQRTASCMGAKIEHFGTATGRDVLASLVAKERAELERMLNETPWDSFPCSYRIDQRDLLGRYQYMRAKRDFISASERRLSNWQPKEPA